MPGYETYSKRQKRLAQAGQSDVYQYDTLPLAFRTQVIHIWQRLNESGDRLVRYLQRHQDPFSRAWWGVVHEILISEIGVFELGDSTNPFEQCQEFLLSSDIIGALDLIELSFNRASRVDNHFAFEGSPYSPTDAIAELNHRFREHSIGYQFEGGQIMRVDSHYIHSDAVKPAIHLLHDANFTGPEEEFMRAHEHYQQGRAKEAITEALKAFESAMKTICAVRGWAYDTKRATAKDLIKIILDNELVPSYMGQQITSLRTLLESGVPTVRNKTSGHGQGKDPIAVPDYYVAFALHSAATNIVLLVEAHNALGTSS
jgi:hypothetical protein